MHEFKGENPNRKVYKKLVRDKIPEIIEADDHMAETRILEQEEYKQALLIKLLEEVNEVQGAKDKEERMKEIGDVLEVLEAIMKANDITQEEVDEIKQKRKKTRGGFEKRIFLEHTEPI
ncbi:nucleoside triphosphate pyrophosphohydrolase [Candidatus Kuenenbacteria bacterium]|nr:nucleoside triphosphate pyrophosphohydrolase [Candidatus Kuenenbacteria bacterium]